MSLDLLATAVLRPGIVRPLICFIYVTFYAAFWPALERLDTGYEVAD